MAVKKSWRGLVSLIMFSSLLISGITGIILFFVPEGRVAFWTLWEMIGVTKAGWQAMHTYSSFLMVIFGVFHLLNNWGSLTNYIAKKSGGLNQTGNIVGVIVISLIIIVSSIWALPPLQWIMDFGEDLKGLWVVSPEYEPPFGHAEELSLSAFGKRMYIDPETAISELEKIGMIVESKKQTIAEIAEANNTRPMDVYIAIKHLENVPRVEKGQQITAEEIEVMFGAGSGSGRKTVAEVAEQVNVTVDLALERLKAAGYDYPADTMLRDIKGDHEELTSAAQVVMIMLDLKPE